MGLFVAVDYVFDVILFWVKAFAFIYAALFVFRYLVFLSEEWNRYKKD